MSERPRQHNLGSRAHDVFDRLIGGNGDSLHPEDRLEAEAFLGWLDGFERPVVESTVPDRTGVRFFAIGAIAASIAALLMLSAPSFKMWSGHEQPFSESFASDRAERRTIQLDDGSVVKLAAASQVDVAYGHDARRIHLVRGEALFDVAHNKAWPFIVQVAHGEVTAVGTSFDVRVNPSDAQVTVVQGVIKIAVSPGALANDDEAITKTARKGEQIRFGIRGGKRSSTGFITENAHVDVGLATAWTHGLLYFQGEPLAQVIDTVNRYSRDKVTLTDSRQARTPVFGVINEGDTAALRELIAHPDSIRVNREG